MFGARYQYALIFLGLISSLFIGVFIYRELYPEYRIYQKDYIALEEFRSTYTHEPPPVFNMGVKQIVINKGVGKPPEIDRCISCHVALEFDHFSPTKIARDVNGEVIYDTNGWPEKIPNDDYIWKKLDQRIAELTDPKKQEGKAYQITANQKKAEALENLKTAHVGEHVYDVTKVLRRHPLIGKETRVFEFHPLNEYGCITCHGGNGRGLTTSKAHGPIYDGDYEISYTGPRPTFLESDEQNDPNFAHAYNYEPGHALHFQTTPLLIGSLMEANCMQCHQGSRETITGAVDEATKVLEKLEEKEKRLKKALDFQIAEFRTLLFLQESINEKGVEETIKGLQSIDKNFEISDEEKDQAASQIVFLNNNKERALKIIQERLIQMVGSDSLINAINDESNQSLMDFLDQHKEEGRGSLFELFLAWNFQSEMIQHAQESKYSMGSLIEKQETLKKIENDVDLLTKNFQQGKDQFLAQACYACHRIDGLSRGGIGPELTESGKGYPWFIKESIVWPQADLKTSTMPNYHLDHKVLEDLMTFLMAQKGRPKAISEEDYRKKLMAFEEGEKLSWEKPVDIAKLHDVRYAMMVFAEEGCAACHRLKGFKSDVGYALEKNNQPDFDVLYQEKEWFQKIIPEDALGSDLVKSIDEHQEEIDKRIVNGVRQNSILEAIEKKNPLLIESFYSNFKYVLRAKNAYYSTLIEKTTNQKERSEIIKQEKQWKDRVNRVLKMYIQEYGLGRLIGPRPNWSGIYRTDEWLIEHFRKPSALTARSIMPVMPFDDTKFHALTYMLDVLGKENRDEVRKIWTHQGFSPQLAYQIHCSQCHGTSLQGNGPVSEWIYPIPKNLRNADFLRNLTKENVISSITHGVKGTPMPPWGEAAMDKPMADGVPVLSKQEIQRIADWLFSSIGRAGDIRGSQQIPKWEYSPEDIIEELKSEDNTIKPGELPETIKIEELESLKDARGIFSEVPIFTSSASDVTIISQTNRNNLSVDEVFEIAPNPYGGPEKDHIFIKKKYYTEENLRAGQNYFELNCAVCHGKEADGLGFRAGTMFDAKPRMLTNINWLETRDDLRLLRSIKYGVPGTSMVPWGDLTSMLQRLQLVIFIRSLSREQILRDQLFSSIYNEFDREVALIDEGRIPLNKKISEIKNELDLVAKKRFEFERSALAGITPPPEMRESAQKELELIALKKQYENIDSVYVSLRGTVEAEGNIYKKLGINLLSKLMLQDAYENYVKIIKDTPAKFSINDGKLEMSYDNELENRLIEPEKIILEAIQRKINKKNHELIIIKGRIPSSEREEKISELLNEIHSLNNLEKEIKQGFYQTRKLREKQKTLYDSLMEKQTNLQDKIND